MCSHSHHHKVSRNEHKDFQISSISSVHFFVKCQKVQKTPFPQCTLFLVHLWTVRSVIVNANSTGFYLIFPVILNGIPMAEILKTFISTLNDIQRDINFDGIKFLN